MDSFSERGFEQTTVAEIAKRAGLTERTFFRYFADKREVLFFGSEQLQNAMLDALRQAPSELSPLEAVAAALETTAQFFSHRREYSQRRQTIIDANPELQERERKKLAAIAASLATALEERGIEPLPSALTGEMGVAIFRVAFEQWLRDPHGNEYVYHLHESLQQLKSVALGMSNVQS